MRMHVLVLPLVEESDSPDVALAAMKSADTRAVVVRLPKDFRLLFNSDVVRARARQVAGLKGIASKGAAVAGLEQKDAVTVWKGLGTVVNLFGPTERDSFGGIKWKTVEPVVQRTLHASGTDYAVLSAQGATAILFTAHEGLRENIRTRRRVCICDHNGRALAEAPPMICTGAPCRHGGSYRCY
jgi:hypothetical protein